MELLIGGDLAPTQSNIDLFSRGDLSKLLGAELLSLWNSVDMRIFNLEVALADEKNPINKCGGNQIAPTRTIHGIRALNPSLIALANNHILDQGETGIETTIQALSKSDIPFIGIGHNLNEACKPFVKEQDVKVGFYACAENEFTIASETTAGANPFDPLVSLDHIAQLQNECDYVIVLYHGGKEHYRYPSPYLQRVCRRMVDKGADLVVCQHSHCIGAFESYKSRTIVYGQGNFLFDGSKSEFWKTSLLVEVIINSSKINVQYIPMIKCDNGVRLAGEQEAEGILQDFYERSRQILDERFLKEEYDRFAAQMFNHYLETLHGRNTVSRILNKLFKHRRMRRIYSSSDLTRIQNIVECEAHRELVLAGLKYKIKQTKS